MNIKRLVTLLEGLCKADPEANVTFKVMAPDVHAKAQLVDGEILEYLDIEAIGSYLGTPGGEDTEGNFMDVVIDLHYNEPSLQVYKKAEEFDKLYKKVAE